MVAVDTGAAPAGLVTAQLASESGRNATTAALGPVAPASGEEGDPPSTEAPQPTTAVTTGESEEPADGGAASDQVCDAGRTLRLPLEEVPDDSVAPWCLTIDRESLKPGSQVTGVVSDGTTELTLTLAQRDRFLIIPLLVVLFGFFVAVVAGVWTNLFPDAKAVRTLLSGQYNKPSGSVGFFRLIAAGLVLLFSVFGVAVASYLPNATFGTWTDYFGLFSAALGWASLGFVITTVGGLLPAAPADSPDPLTDLAKAREELKTAQTKVESAIDAAGLADRSETRASHLAAAGSHTADVAARTTEIAQAVADKKQPPKDAVEDAKKSADLAAKAAAAAAAVGVPGSPRPP